MKQEFNLGQGVEVRGKFRDPQTKQLVDPDSVFASLRRPDGTIILLTVASDEPGIYTARGVVDVPGLWYYRMSSSDPGAAAYEGTFEVRQSAFA